MKNLFERVPKDVLVLRAQARKHDGEYLNRLADSLVRGQLQPIGVLKDYSVIWGNARVLAARSKPEITHLWAAVFDEPVTEREFQRMRFIENQLRKDLTNAEKCQNCVEYANSEPGLTLKQIAADLGVDPSLVTRWMAWDKVIEGVRQALVADKLTLTGMYAISQLPQEQQAAALVSALAAPNAAAVTRAVRKQRNGSSTVKTARVKCAMPSGVLVTLAGEGDGLTLDDVIETLTELLKEAKRANDQGLDSKTFSAVLRDKAKAS
jgi:ParB-like chromosome segregation protein Spo0J